MQYGWKVEVRKWKNGKWKETDEFRLESGRTRGGCTDRHNGGNRPCPHGDRHTHTAPR